MHNVARERLYYLFIILYLDPREILTELNSKCKEVGLKINISKTRYVTSNNGNDNKGLKSVDVG